MCMLDRRVQILLDQERHERLLAESRRRRLSVGALIREAIDRAYPSRSRARRAAADAILAAEPMPMPDPQELKAELDELRARGL
jgi:hypothetical protein